jgi:hypothetical protein
MSTTAEEARAGHGPHGPDHGDHCRTVEIHVNNHPVFLQPGRYDVPTLKRVAGVPQAEELEELVDCKLKPVPDDATIPIQGCEVFISHVREGGAS